MSGVVTVGAQIDDPPLGGVVDRLATELELLCDRGARPDLARRLQRARATVGDRSFRVLVVGEFKQGKSSLVNALLGTDVCPVDDDIATSVPTVVSFAQEPSALVYPMGDDAKDPTPVSLQDLPLIVTEAESGANSGRVRLVEVGLPRRFLETGLVLVDTPGIGGLGSPYVSLLASALPAMDATLVVSDGAQSYSESELQFLRRCRRMCPRVACIVTKTDLFPDWRRVAATDRALSGGAGRASLPVFPVSSSLRAEAIRRDDAGLNEESGFPALMRYLLGDVVADAGRGATSRAAVDLVFVSSELARPLAVERQALDDPDAVGELQTQLRRARRSAEELRGDASRWNQTLNDGASDLTADVEHDLRMRLRGILREAEERIDSGDPGDWWEEFERWLGLRTGAEIAANFELLHQRATTLVERVAEHFRDAVLADSLPVALNESVDPLSWSDGLLGAVNSPEDLSARAGAAASTGLAAVRGAYGGMFLFNALTGLVGLTAIGPAVLGVTALMGHKSARDERNRRLAQRRQEAKAAVRRFVDDTTMKMGKESRDTLRRVHRQLRDEFATRADQVQRTTTESLRHLERQVDDAESARTARCRAIDAELDRLRMIARDARALAAPANAEPAA